MTDGSAPQRQLPPRTLPPMLIVEDSDEDYEAIQRFVRRSPIPIPVQRCMSGDHALAFLSESGDPNNNPRPSLIVLDLNLPGIDGREVLRQIKQDDTLKAIPIIIFTTSNNPKDKHVCYEYGIDRYIVKPIDFEQLKRDVQTLIDYWCNVTPLTDSLENDS